MSTTNAYQKRITTDDGKSQDGFVDLISKTKTANYTVTHSDSTLLGDSTSGAFSFQLPPANTVNGLEFTFKKTDTSTNSISITADGSELIDGVSTRTLLKQYGFISVKSIGSGWIILSISLICDEQSVSASNTINSSSSSFTDLSSMTLTTKNLGESGHYQIWFSGSFLNSATDIQVQIVVDGVAVSSSIRKHEDSGKYGELSTIAQSVNISSGTIIKVQWKINSGTGTCTNRTLMINGIGTSKIAS